MLIIFSVVNPKSPVGAADSTSPLGRDYDSTHAPPPSFHILPILPVTQAHFHSQSYCYFLTGSFTRLHFPFPFLSFSLPPIFLPNCPGRHLFLLAPAPLRLPFRHVTAPPPSPHYSLSVNHT